MALFEVTYTSSYKTHEGRDFNGHGMGAVAPRPGGRVEGCLPDRTPCTGGASLAATFLGGALWETLDPYWVAGSPELCPDP